MKITEKNLMIIQVLIALLALFLSYKAFKANEKN